MKAHYTKRRAQGQDPFEILLSTPHGTRVVARDGRNQATAWGQGGNGFISTALVDFLFPEAVEEVGQYPQTKFWVARNSRVFNTLKLPLEGATRKKGDFFNGFTAPCFPTSGFWASSLPHRNGTGNAACGLLDDQFHGCFFAGLDLDGGHGEPGIEESGGIQRGINGYGRRAQYIESGFHVFH